MLYPASEVRNLATGLDHPEGLAVAVDGSIYAGGEGGQVYKIEPGAGKFEIVAETGGFCLGVTLDRKENIYICDPGRRALLRVTAKGEVETLVESVDGRRLVNPNFSVFDPAGNLYFSDSGEWKKANGVIYRLRTDGECELFCAGPFHFANGLALDRKGCFLYVVESNLDRVLRIEIRSDGAASAPEVFADGLVRVPDGLAFDADGNLYVTTYASNCIYRVTPGRRNQLLCQDVENLLLCQPTNCAFGGSEFDQLYVANLGRNHISVLDLKIKGQKLWNHDK